MKKTVKCFVMWLMAAGLFQSACRDAFEYDAAPSHQLQFSTDTLQLDTVFSTIPSSSRRLTLYNPHAQRIDVQVSAEQLIESGFSVLADGHPLTGQPFNLTVEACDSLALFVSVTAPEQHCDTLVPLLRMLLFETNGRTRSVAVEAAVQDVIGVTDTLADTLHWSGRKPYLVWNSLRVNNLTIDAGVTVYLHHLAGLQVMRSLEIRGTADRPVLLAGDRLENTYRSYPGQWGSLVLDGGGASYLLSHAEIRNGTNGLLITAAPDPGQKADVRLSACRVLNMAYAGIENASASLHMDNTVVANCGYHTLHVTGGSCRLYHCTLTNNYNRYMVRHARPALCLLPEAQECSGTSVPRFGFYNTTICGTLTNEIQLEDDLTDRDVLFDHCLVRTGSTIYEDPMFRDCVRSAVLPFKDAAGEDFSPDSLSAAVGIGSLVTAADWPLDLAGKDRTADGAPDAGAYEYQGR